MTAHLYRGVGFSSSPADCGVPPYYVDFELMDNDSQQQKRQDNVLSSLDVAIEVLNLAEKILSITPAKAAFGSVASGKTYATTRDYLMPPGSCGNIV